MCVSMCYHQSNWYCWLTIILTYMFHTWQGPSLLSCEIWTHHLTSKHVLIKSGKVDNERWYFVSYHVATWWRHQTQAFFALLVICGGIHRPPGNSPHKGQWRGTLMFSLICAWINNGDAGDLRRHGAHYDAPVKSADVLLKILIHKMSLESTLSKWQPHLPVVNKLTPKHIEAEKKKCRHFADDIFKCPFLKENYQFRLKFHWSLFLRFGLAPNRRQAIIWTNDG